MVCMIETFWVYLELIYSYYLGHRKNVIVTEILTHKNVVSARFL